MKPALIMAAWTRERRQRWSTSHYAQFGAPSSDTRQRRAVNSIDMNGVSWSYFGTGIEPFLVGYGALSWSRYKRRGRFGSLLNDIA